MESSLRTATPPTGWRRVRARQIAEPGASPSSRHALKTRHRSAHTARRHRTLVISNARGTVQQRRITPRMQPAIQSRCNMATIATHESATVQLSPAARHRARARVKRRYSPDSRDLIVPEPTASTSRHAYRGGFRETRPALQIRPIASYSRLEVTRGGEGSANCSSSLFLMPPNRDARACISRDATSRICSAHPKR